MITASKIACPVCEGEHPSGPRLVGLVVIACDKLTPVGETRVFPILGVIVAGAGLGVDVPLPPKPSADAAHTPSVSDLEAKRDALLAKKRAPDLLAEIAALEAELAPPTPPVEPDAATEKPS